MSFKSKTISILLMFISLNLKAAILERAPIELDEFFQARYDLVKQIEKFELQNADRNQSPLIHSIRNLKAAYQKIDRKTLAPEWLYNSQFQLRFINRKLRTTLNKLYQKNDLSNKVQQELEYEAQILNYKNQNYYLSPQKSLPIVGTKGSDWPLSRWQKDSDFYQYNFENNDVIYRGLRLQSGDLILNHPAENPVGIFTAITDKRSIFSHAAMVVIIYNQWGKLPVVVDIHERGIRAVPLHHYLSPKVISYGEIFRLKNKSPDFDLKLNNALKVLMSTPHPYDLTGSEDRKALSCTEMVSYMMELLGLQKISMKNKIELNIFKNILKFGNLGSPIIQMPNDVLLDSRFYYLGYIDNTPSLKIQVTNEILLDLFHEKMELKIAKSNKSLSRFFGEIAIDQVRTKYSLFGGFILGATGFTRETFPAGHPGLLTAINAIDHIFVKAMNRCLGTTLLDRTSSCYKQITASTIEGLNTFDYSIHQWKADPTLRTVANQELKGFDQMFE
jgi:hypothetical protein